MKKIIIGLLIVLSFVVGSTHAYAYVSVHGYYRSNGTYVAPYVRSNPNGLKYDNYGYKSSQGLYNPTYGTKGTNWDTPTYITDPNYYEGKALYDQGKTGSSGSSSLLNTYLYPSYIKPTLPTKNVSYVTKMWVDNNPATSCTQSTFLRAKEKTECELYKIEKSNYVWSVTTTEFDGKHYTYNPETKITNSCPDGYFLQYDSAGKLMSSCGVELSPILQSFPKGCTSTMGFSPISGLSCAVNVSCAPGLIWDGKLCVKE